MFSTKSLEQLSSQLDKANKSLPPVESWNPPYCGEIDLQIKGNGDWYFGGTIFKRISLVKMFASVLIREMSGGDTDNPHDEYFLVTPVEKVKITVEEQPFVLTQWQWLDDAQTMMQVSTNVGDEFILDAEHALMIDEQGNLSVNVRRNLFAKVHRNVYYQWVELAQELISEKGTELVFYSANTRFTLGCV